MTPDQAIQRAKSGDLQPVYLIVGEERYFENAVIQALRQAALEGGVPGLNEDQFVAGEAEVDAVLGIARTLPMMARRRVVLVRQLERWEVNESKASSKASDAKAHKKTPPFERLLAYADKPSETTVLILAGAKVDKRRRLVTQAKSAGWLVSCDPPSRAELPRWIEQSAKQLGNTLAPGVADLLAELSGPELATILDALQRVCLYAGQGRTVTEDAVAECVVRIRPATVWELVGAVGRRDAGSALRALDQVFDPQDRGLRLVGVLAWSARQLLKFESAMRAGLKPPDAAKQAGAPPFKARELADQVRSIPRWQLERWLSTLADVDLALKGGSKRPPKAVLEGAVLELCQRHR